MEVGREVAMKRGQRASSQNCGCCGARSAPAGLFNRSICKYNMCISKVEVFVLQCCMGSLNYNSVCYFIIHRTAISLGKLAQSDVIQCNNSAINSTLMKLLMSFVDTVRS